MDLRSSKLSSALLSFDNVIFSALFSSDNRLLLSSDPSTLAKNPSSAALLSSDGPLLDSACLNLRIADNFLFLEATSRRSGNGMSLTPPTSSNGKFARLSLDRRFFSAASFSFLNLLAERNCFFLASTIFRNRGGES